MRIASLLGLLVQLFDRDFCPDLHRPPIDPLILVTRLGRALVLNWLCTDPRTDPISDIPIVGISRGAFVASALAVFLYLLSYRFANTL